MNRVGNVACQEANSKTWTNLVEIPDGSGKVKGVGVALANQNPHSIKVKIDGRTVVKDMLCRGVRDAGNDGMNLDLPFEESLKIFIRDDHKPMCSTRFWASYVVDQP